jgi:hypothetical protein
VCSVVTILDYKRRRFVVLQATAYVLEFKKGLQSLLQPVVIFTVSRRLHAVHTTLCSLSVAALTPSLRTTTLHRHPVPSTFNSLPAPSSTSNDRWQRHYGRRHYGRRHYGRRHYGRRREWRWRRRRWQRNRLLLQVVLLLQELMQLVYSHLQYAIQSHKAALTQHSTTQQNECLTFRAL